MILIATGLVILATLIWGYVVWLECREHRQRMDDLRDD